MHTKGTRCTEFVFYIWKLLKELGLNSVLGVYTKIGLENVILVHVILI
jgi:hypothetical protein